MLFFVDFTTKILGGFCPPYPHSGAPLGLPSPCSYICPPPFDGLPIEPERREGLKNDREASFMTHSGTRESRDIL